ncbi:uncharacterized protein BX664DRAFT_358214 [Halteromyces radiatus]|uniref:uncharacterized protein n=1 Tax=Halteromyces radiatus TaxID=101107 RepID=UPI00221F1A5C|nr:uncharacterized protein BX664DRAFT_358214 [Halteromyces radiatus]KAI8093830.1 hypothetical protein BX664DRAFT_358214 [Halteromyces radiatus]
MSLPSCLKDSRCIIHIDLDCFFCQVEEVRLGLDSSKPVAVQQWSSLIAVNYAARAYGVTRHSSVDDAKKLCPEITLVHVATYAPNESVARYHDNPSRATHKVNLDAYRDAGNKILQIFGQHCSLLQKVGSDEAFLDMTEAANERLCKQYIPTHPVLMERCITDGESTVILDDHRIDWTNLGNLVPSTDELKRKESSNNDDNDDDDPTSWFDIQLAMGAEIAAEIRKQVWDELHYTCSAGIAHNKVLAKLGSSMNKPNKQTIVRQHVALSFIQDIPFNKIRNLGGKFGQAVEEEYNVQKASDLWPISLKELQDKFGESSGQWLYNIVRGIDHEEVILLKAPKSLMASKIMTPPLTNEKELRPWYSVLSGELHNRIMKNWEEHQTWPKTLSISHRTRGVLQTKSTSMINRNDSDTHEKLQQIVTQMFTTMLDDIFPCSSISLQATGLTTDVTATNYTIHQFFKTSKEKDDIISTSTQIINTWTCDRCHQRISLEQVDEHTDYHFALDLEKEEQSSRVSQKSTTKQVRGNGEKRKDRQDSMKRLDKKPKRLFFTP